MFQQHRYRSTFLLRRTYITRKPLIRYVWSQSSFRKIGSRQLPDLKSWQIRCQVQHIQRHIYKTALRDNRPVSFTPTAVYHFDARQSDYPKLSHLTAKGNAHMVDVGGKKVTHRSATAVAYLLFSNSATGEALVSANVRKGDALAVARIAGIQAAKRTADLIPLAHPGLGITAVNIDIEPMPANTASETDEPKQHSSASDQDFIKSEHGGVYISATVDCYGKTGVEMEALTAANVTALTMYDMLKAIDKAMVITGSRVIEKRGGKSGAWRWNKDTEEIERFDVTEISKSVTSEVPTTQQAYEDDSTTPPQPYLPSKSFSQTSNLAHSCPSPAQISSSSSPRHNDPSEPTAQSVFEAEWDDLSTSFGQTSPPPPYPTNTHQYPQSRLRDKLSGTVLSRPDTESLRLARIQRYEEWKKTR